MTPTTQTRWMLAGAAILHAVGWALLSRSQDDPAASFLFLAAVTIETVWIGFLVRQARTAAGASLVGAVLSLAARHIVPVPVASRDAGPFAVTLVGLGATVAYGVGILS